MAFFHKLAQLALAGDDVADVQPRKFVLARRRGLQQAAFGQARQQPVVKRALVFKFERADAVGDLLQRVFNRVREGVHGVDAPFVARVVVRGVADAVDGRVAHVDVGRGHVDLGAQHHAAVGVLAGPHFGKARQVLRRAALAPGAVFAGGVEVAPVDAHFVRRLLVHVGQARFDQIDGGAVHEVEIVAGKVFVRLADAGARRVVGQVMVVAQPANGFADAVHVFLVFLFGVGVVKAQVAHAAVFPRQAEVEPNAFGVPDVQIAIGFGWKAGADAGRIGRAGGVVRAVSGAAAPVAALIRALRQVVFDDVAQEIAGNRCFFGGRHGR